MGLWGITWGCGMPRGAVGCHVGLWGATWGCGVSRGAVGCHVGLWDVTWGLRRRHLLMRSQLAHLHKVPEADVADIVLAMRRELLCVSDALDLLPLHLEKDPGRERDPGREGSREGEGSGDVATPERREAGGGRREAGGGKLLVGE